MPYYPEKAAPYVSILSYSFRKWTGRDILDDARGAKGADLTAALFEAPCPLVSHGTEADPVFRYANRAALKLWEMEWDEFTRMPSRLSAAPDPDVQEDRTALLKAALQKGWVENYRGVRRSSTGNLFVIDDTVLWNVVDADGVRHGQAALIKSWTSK
jgi:hypothetical protein